MISPVAVSSPFLRGRPSLIAAVLLPCLLALLSPLAPAQKGQSLPVFGADLQEAQAQLFHRVHEGDLQVALEIEITEGFHLYHSEMGNPEAIGYPTSVTLGGEGVSWSAVRFPEPLVLEQFDTWVYAHEHTIVLYALGETDGDPSAVQVSAEIDGLTCEDDGTCVPYAESLTSQGEGGRADLFAAFPADLAVGAGEDGPDAGADQPSAVQARSAVPIEGAAAAEYSDAEYEAVRFGEYTPVTGDDGDRSTAVWLLLAFVAGVLLNVMPCVLPVISIKVLSFVQQAGEDRSRILALGLAFAAGILVVFLVLAAFAAFAGQGWGEQFQSQPFLIVMIGLVFAFSLSMFGVYELGVPSGVGAMAGGAPKEGLGDAFFKGMLATVLATPCSGPFLGSTMTWTLRQEDALLTFAIFTSLGLGMAIPYVVLTANPAFLKLVPRPGPWMDTFKEAMGFVLLGTAVFLMTSLYTNLLLVTVAFLVFVALGCWWWGRFSRTAATTGRKWATLVVALAIMAGGARLSFVELHEVVSPGEGVGWEEFDHERFEQLLAEGTPVFVDWTATWCMNCHFNKTVVFDSDEVVAAMADAGVVRMIADVSQDSPRTRMLKRLQGAVGGSAIPFAALFRPDEARSPFVLYDVVTKGQVLDAVGQL